MNLSAPKLYLKDIPKVESRKIVLWFFKKESLIGLLLERYFKLSEFKNNELDIKKRYNNLPW